MAQANTVGHGESLEHVPQPLLANVYQEGLIAGVLGAATVAIWFLVVDSIQGRPLYTPTVLGTVLFRGSGALDAPELLKPSLETVVVFTWIHFLVFVLIGGAAARLLVTAQTAPNFSFGVILLFVIFECGFVAAATGIEQKVLQSLTWPSIAAGNLLAAIVMAYYFHRRHPALHIRP